MKRIWRNTECENIIGSKITDRMICAGENLPGVYAIISEADSFIRLHVNFTH